MQITLYLLDNGIQVGSVILMMYVDDILVTSGDSMGVEETKQHLKKYFVIKDQINCDIFSTLR